jgi:hypothetical protein
MYQLIRQSDSAMLYYVEPISSGTIRGSDGPAKDREKAISSAKSPDIGNLIDVKKTFAKWKIGRELSITGMALNNEDRQEWRRTYR